MGSSNDSCILKLTIKGVVNLPEGVHVCTADDLFCDHSVGLNVNEAASIPLSGIAVGYYSNQQAQFFPLLAYSIDNGVNWQYPNEIFRNLKNQIDPNFANGILLGGDCAGAGGKSRCIATGNYCTTDDCSSTLPLIAVGKNNLSQWSYPKAVHENLTQIIDPNLTVATLNDGSCVGSGGSTVCFGAGSYFTSSRQFPLIALTTNGGLNWTYPSSVYQDLGTKIDPNFVSGYLQGTSCSLSGCNRICIAAGAYFCAGSSCDSQLPLLAMSTTNTNEWTYPTAIFSNLQSTIDPNFNNGFLKSASCTSSTTISLCIATGQYSNGSTTYPLLAETQDNGQTWRYPSEIHSDLETKIAHGFVGGFFNGASCSGRNKKAVCVAAGAYFTQTHLFPFLAVSRDGGESWLYPSYIYTKFQTDVSPNAASGGFEDVSCSGNGNTAFCVAAGNFCLLDDTQSCGFLPLVALSTNGGKNWAYLPDVYTNLTTKIAANFKEGFFNSISCNSTATRSFCVASGQYITTDFDILPMIAISTDRGMTWIYPREIHANLNVTIDPGFSGGGFVFSAVTGGGVEILVVG